MLNRSNKLKDFFVRRVWEIDINSLGKYRSFVIKSMRLFYVGMREFTKGQLTLRAMSLVYTTLLSIIPMLAISFSLLKAFGVHNQVIEPFLLKFLTPLGPKGEEITYQITEFVENIKVGVLGSFGLAMLIYTGISVIQKIESSFNSIWGIRKTRSLIRKFGDYISIILIVPVLILAAIGITASAMSTTVVKYILTVKPFGMFFYFAAEIFPYIIVCAVFTFLYTFIPNTKVKFKSALVGGIFASVLWETTGWLFASFIVKSTKYAAIYSGFAILIMFMIWLYLSWLILLVGAQVTFYHQYPQFLTTKKEVFRMSNRIREKLAFLVMFFIGYSFYHNKQPWTLNSIVDHLRLPVEPVQDILILLEQNNLILETHDDPPAYIPARAIEKITLTELLGSVRVTEKETLPVEKTIVSVAAVDRITKKLDDAVGNTLGEETLRDLVCSAKEENI